MNRSWTFDSGNIKSEFRLTRFLHKNISLIKAAKLPEKALLQRLAGGAASMAPRPARIKMPHEAERWYQKMPQRDVRGFSIWLVDMVRFLTI
ncbi:hypothetical protein [Xylella fastidiosa]|uniref:hypothetical protein n=1 Tax=Xylella fastidiosa TaxID=2371 RepID=UPI0007661136|nr:hypothetical protein [Xylella fastidiosa]KXB20791.1 hypothetical protein ADT30_05855 [Xylella fastidiosa]